MHYKEFQENLRLFSEIIEKLSHTHEQQTAKLVKRYIDQNLIILNDIIATSIDNFKALQKIKNPAEMIYIQTKLTQDLNKKLTQSTQYLLNVSLDQIADYNEWLKAHCDFATD